MSLISQASATREDPGAAFHQESPKHPDFCGVPVAGSGRDAGFLFSYQGSSAGVDGATLMSRHPVFARKAPT